MNSGMYRVLDNLNTLEICLMIQADSSWRLPAKCYQAIRRMEEGRAMLRTYIGTPPDVNGEWYWTKDTPDVKGEREAAMNIDRIPEITPDQWEQTRWDRTASICTDKPMRPRHLPREKTGGRPSKPVLCVETGRVFSSPRDAARSIGATENAVRQAIYCEGRCKGMTWRYKREREAA